jgi:hypothetical protein
MLLKVPLYQFILSKSNVFFQTWGRGMIAKIDSRVLGRTVGAVRSMLCVLTKEGLLVRVGNML